MSTAEGAARRSQWCAGCTWMPTRWAVYHIVALGVFVAGNVLKWTQHDDKESAADEYLYYTNWSWWLNLVFLLFTVPWPATSPVSKWLHVALYNTVTVSNWIVWLLILPSLSQWPGILVRTDDGVDSMATRLLGDRLFHGTPVIIMAFYHMFGHDHIHRYYREAWDAVVAAAARQPGGLHSGRATARLWAYMAFQALLPLVPILLYAAISTPVARRTYGHDMPSIVDLFGGVMLAWVIVQAAFTWMLYPVDLPTAPARPE